jgi:hypothetical protein
MSYSFTEPIVIQLLRMSHKLIPGLIRVIGIRWDAAEGTLRAHCIDYPREGASCEPMEIPSAATTALQQLRAGVTTYNWYHPRELPFETEVFQEKQLDVFQEMERNILMIPLQNEDDGKSDLILLYFAENFSTFRLSNANKSLFPEHRIIIGTMVFNSIRTIWDINRNDREVLRQINNSTRSIIDRYRESQEELKRLTQGVQRNILDISKHLLEEIAPGDAAHFVLTPQAVEKLKKFKGDIPELKAILKNAVTFASALDFGSDKEEIFLEEYHIDLDLQRKSGHDNAPALMPSARYAKTVALLDKLEEAAARVLKQQLPLTGANVGNACSKAISAPAVTDALKKHKSKIITLLKEYPDRWNLLRSEFRPLINIISIKKPADEQALNAG